MRVLTMFNLLLVTILINTIGANEQRVLTPQKKRFVRKVIPQKEVNSVQFEVIWREELPDDGYCEDIEVINLGNNYYAVATSDNGHIYAYTISPSGGVLTWEDAISNFNAEDADYDENFHRYFVADSTGELFVYEASTRDGRFFMTLIRTFALPLITEVAKRTVVPWIDGIIENGRRAVKANHETGSWQAFAIEGVGLLWGLAKKALGLETDQQILSEYIFFVCDSGLVVIDTSLTEVYLYQPPEDEIYYDAIVGSPDGTHLYAFIASYSPERGYVDAFDITDPANGQYLWSVRLADGTYAYEIDYDGDFLTVTDMDDGCCVIDVSDINHPEILGYWNDDPLDAEVEDVEWLPWTTFEGKNIVRYFLLADGDGGVYMIKMREVGIGEKKSRSSPFTSGFRQISPNPFLDQTQISYSLSKEAEVNLKVFNTSGEIVKMLVNGKQKPGHYNITWNGCDEKGNKIPPGIYFSQLKAGEFVATKKIVKME